MPRGGDPGFDDDVLHFAVSDLRSVWALEVLLLMHGDAQKRWTAEGLTRELRANLGMVEDILRRLVTLGLVTPQEDGFVFQPVTSQLANLVDRTSTAYRQKPFAMISLIGRGARVLQELADAFRLKGGKP